MGFYNSLVIGVQTKKAKKAKKKQICPLKSRKIYIRFDDKSMTMLNALPSRPQGIKFKYETHNAHKYRKFQRPCRARSD